MIPPKTANICICGTSFYMHSNSKHEKHGTTLFQNENIRGHALQAHGKTKQFTCVSVILSAVMQTSKHARRSRSPMSHVLRVHGLLLRSSCKHINCPYLFCCTVTVFLRGLLVRFYSSRCRSDFRVSAPTLTHRTQSRFN